MATFAESMNEHVNKMVMAECLMRERELELLCERLDITGTLEQKVAALQAHKMHVCKVQRGPGSLEYGAYAGVPPDEIDDPNAIYTVCTQHIDRTHRSVCAAPEGASEYSNYVRAIHRMLDERKREGVLVVSIETTTGQRLCALALGAAWDT